MSIYVGNSEIKNIYIGTTAVKEVYVGTTKVRPTADTRTFTISWTEQSNMSSGWTYSDDAAGLTAGSGDFDDFFGYSAVLLNTSGAETAEMKQSKGVFTGAMTTLGNITNGNNVMIKFPLRGIKMSKSGGVVTLSITGEPNKTGYQYYAFQTGTLSSPGTAKDKFYLGAYEGYINSNVLKSWSGKSPNVSQTQGSFCTKAKANGSGYNIMGFYQRMYINALYMMKYGNPNSQSVVGKGYSGGSSKVNTGGTNSQTNATYGTSSATTQIKLFGLEDRWGNINDFVGGAHTDSSKKLYVRLSGYSGQTSGGEYTGSVIQHSGGNCISSIVGDNKSMFGPSATVNNGNFNTYYCDLTYVDSSSQLLFAGGPRDYGAVDGALNISARFGASDTINNVGARLMYLDGLS